MVRMQSRADSWSGSGAVLATLGRASLDYIELSPAEIKLSVAGHGRADKKQVAQMVERLLK